MNSDRRHDHVRDRRVQYETAGLDRADLDASPITQWHRWYNEAVEADLPEPNAMVVGTIDHDDLPDSRVVLVRAVDDDGLCFYGNYESAKGRQIAGRPGAAAVFPWLGLHRQVRVRGRVELMSAAESDAYFASRPRESQLGAWASPQSESIADRSVLEVRLAEATQRFPGVVERPPHWGGWRLVPVSFEFWQGRPSRLHDRFRYTLEDSGNWTITRLAP
ncbi:MAG: pyridoxine/pyridoxamine 5-phosphate oxidase [Actinomycetota bacterium]|jgi:pyridoxamine 5'-phosphate oxidase